MEGKGEEEEEEGRQEENGKFDFQRECIVLTVVSRVKPASSSLRKSNSNGIFVKT